MDIKTANLKFPNLSTLNKTDAARELMEKGFIMYQLEEYKSGNLSLGKMAENLGLPISETLNLVSQFRAHPKIPRDYIVEAWETTRSLFGHAQ